MEWLEVDKDNLPDGNVLAANFEAGTYGYKEKLVGFLSWDEDEEFVVCEGEGVVLENCTHYIDIDKFDIV